MAIAENTYNQSEIENQQKRDDINDHTTAGFTLQLGWISFVTRNSYVGASILLSLAILLFAVFVILVMSITDSVAVDLTLIYDFIKSAFLLVVAIGFTRKNSRVKDVIKKTR